MSRNIKKYILSKQITGSIKSIHVYNRIMSCISNCKIFKRTLFRIRFDLYMINYKGVDTT
jgi:hypothetical protein